MYKFNVLTAMLLGSTLMTGCDLAAESDETIHASSRQALRVSYSSQIATGRNHGMALRPDGTVWAWGQNGTGALGDGTNVARLFPVQVAQLSDVVSIWAGAYYSLAVRSDGTLWAWGDNAKGQLGDGTISLRYAPVQVTGITDVVAVAAGYDHTLAVRSDGTLWAWGDNSKGQLGDGTNLAKKAPVQLAALTDVVAIAAGRHHSLAVLANGTVWAWGYNNNGQLGDGTTTNRNAPVQVQTPSGALTGVVDIGAGEYFSLAVLSSGTVQGWGDNSFGQLGNGTTVDCYRAEPVQNLDGVVFVDGSDNGQYFSVASKSDGSVWAWGNNNLGQLGDNTSNCPNYEPIRNQLPIQVMTLDAVTSVSASAYFTLAQESDGSTYFWGTNTMGQAGNGTTGGCARAPVLVQGLP